MKLRPFQIIALVATLLTGWVFSEERPPNVVLIFIDDLGYGDVGAFGCPDIPTPHIDQLAAEGVTCTTSYITNPPCCPSRCSLMVGQYAQRFGKYGMSRGLPIPEDRPTLAAFMRDHGYVTGQIGKWDLGSPLQGPLNVGFTQVAKTPPKKKYKKDYLKGVPKGEAKFMQRLRGKSKYFCIREDGSEAWLTDYDGDKIVEFVESNQDQPFFLYYSPEAVHSPNMETPERLMNRTSAKGLRRKLAGAIVAIDDQVGKLVASLEKANLRQNTLIIFSSDNGPNPGEEGSAAPYTGGKGNGTQKEGWVRVPTIFSYPGKIPDGKTYSGQMATFDYYATIAAAIGKPVPEHCDGVDLLPWFTGEKEGDAHEWLFWLNNDPTDAIRRRLIAARWKNWRLYQHKEEGWKLYDLVADPKEEKDFSSEHPEVVREMKKRHEDWAATLPPMIAIPDIKLSEPVIPEGHGWAYAKEN